MNKILLKEINRFRELSGLPLLIERYDINNLSDDIVLFSVGLNVEYCKFLLYNIKTKRPIGYISFGIHKPIGSFTVDGAYSESGYGPFLYECAMTYVYPNGLSMSRVSETSDEALSVWKKFKERSDVENERINSDELTFKKDILKDADVDETNPILDLEDTRFKYNFGKDKLDKLIRIGKEYRKNNNISDKDVEEMSYSLE